MKAFELLLAAICFGLGIRSLVFWIRHPVDGADTTDLVLFSLFVTGRVAMWFCAAALFAIYASIDTRGQAFLDDVGQYRWFLLVLLSLAAIQFVASFLLSRRTPQD